MSKERAVELRAEGKSLSQIAEILGHRSTGGVLSRWLKGVPPPTWTKRPTAKDDLRAAAVDLRLRGWTYGEIVAALGVSKGTLSAWLHDVLVADEGAERLQRARDAGQRKGAAARRAMREAREVEIKSRASAAMPAALVGSELFMAGLALYWAEGGKAKPWNPSQRVSFINSDPDIIRVFLAWLALIGVAEDELIFRVAIHKTGDVAAAERFWAGVVGIEESELRPTTRKTHETLSGRRLPLADYVGCLRVDVPKSTDLNRQIAGWWQGFVAAVATVEAPSGMV
ncbi:MAG TPA: helix-turn-helix domain-containing protein [Acidimicrobiales bacterium]|nr:helix-turn-helix domain-containing protein [Acidimicrobiales bacterium]